MRVSDVTADEQEFGERFAALVRLMPGGEKELSARTGLSVDMIQRKMRGIGVKQYLDLGLLAQALGTSPNALLGMSEVSGSQTPPEVFRSSFQGMLEMMGIPAPAARELAQEAIGIALEQQIAGEDRQTVARILAKSRAGEFLSKLKKL